MPIRSSTPAATHGEHPEELLAFPPPRTCPFSPPQELLAVQRTSRVERVTLWDGSHPWLVTGYAEVRAALADPRVSSNTDLPNYPHNGAGDLARRRLAKTFVNMDGHEHDYQRRLVTRDFTVRRMEAMRPQIQQIVDDLIDALLAGPRPVDLVQAFALPLPSLLICQILGVPYEDRETFQTLSARIISRTSTPAEAEANLRAFQQFLADQIHTKDGSPGDDLLSRLVVEQLRPGHLSEEELVNLCQLLLTAGHETTANMIALGTLTLLEHPDVLAELQATSDHHLIATAVEELLRFLNIVHNGRRRVALEDMTIAGKQIRAGDALILAHDVADRDDDAYTDPEKLDIRRSPNRHLAFAYGVHQCLGQSLARVELQVVYGTLYRRIPGLRLAVPIEDLTFKSESFVYGVEALPVTW